MPPSLRYYQSETLDYPVIFTTPIRISKPIFIAKGRGHAHHLGITAGLFVKNNSTQRWERVFEYDVQKDQNFHDIKPPFRIDHSQDIAIRCTYDSSTQTKKTVFGTSKYNEMCFAHFIYYSEGEEMEIENYFSGVVLPENFDSLFPAPIIQLKKQTKSTLPAIVMFCFLSISIYKFGTCRNVQFFRKSSSLCK